MYFSTAAPFDPKSSARAQTQMISLSIVGQNITTSTVHQLNSLITLQVIHVLEIPVEKVPQYDLSTTASLPSSLEIVPSEELFVNFSATVDGITIAPSDLHKSAFLLHFKSHIDRVSSTDARSKSLSYLLTEPVRARITADISSYHRKGCSKPYLPLLPLRTFIDFDFDFRSTATATENRDS